MSLPCAVSTARLGRRAGLVIDTMLPSGSHPALSIGAFDTDFDGFYDDFAGPRP